MVLKIEIQEAQENVLVYEKGAHRGVPLHSCYPEPKGRGVVHAAAGQERSVSSPEEEGGKKNGTASLFRFTRHKQWVS